MKDFDGQCLEYYFKAIDSFIMIIYQRRYGTLEPKIQGAIPLDTYVNACWEKMEGTTGETGDLLTAICARDFENDAALSQFIRLTFEHLLQDIIYQQTPGLRTRVQQLNRLMHSICDLEAVCTKKILKKKMHDGDNKMKTYKRYFWKLKELDAPPLIFPTGLEELESLRNCLTIHPPPVPMPFQRKDGEYGVRIHDGEMKDFLKKIMTQMGGVVSRNGLIAFISEVYNLVPLIFGPIPAQGENQDFGDEQVSMDMLFRDKSLTHEYPIIAKELIQTCDKITKTVFFFRYCEQWNQNKIAEMLNISNSTVSNKIKAIEICFLNLTKEHPMTEDEFLSFKDLICQILLHMEEGPK